MQYYKVLKDYTSRKLKSGGIYGYFREGELLTKKEREKYINSPYIFEVVVISKNKTYKQFYSNLQEFKRFKDYTL